MKFKRQHALAAALIITLALSAHVAMQDESHRKIVQPTDARTTGAKTSGPAPNGQPAAAKNDERDPLLEAATDPFKVVNFVAPVQAAPAAPPPPAPVVQPKPVAPQFPYQYFGRMVDVDGQKLTFLSRDSVLVPIKVGTMLDDVYRIDAVADKQISLTYLPLNEQISISVQSAAE
jgi:hypothetical protein